MAKRRAVGATRLSSMTEDTTSPKRQREVIQGWADRPENNAEIIGWAEDLDVSASIPPQVRPQLGPWLRGECGEFDVLVFAKLDRAVRSLNDFVNLDKWATDESVGLVILDPPLDLTNMWGRAMAQVLAIFAELERQMIKKRTKEGYEELLKVGRWPGGRVPYGYKTVKIPGRDGWWLVIDEDQAEILRKIIGRIIGGASTLSQAKWLNDQAISTARGATSWQHSVLYDMLRSPALLGQWPDDNGGVLRDDQGMPIQRAEPIIARDVWDRLQAALDANAKRTTGNRYDAAPLLRVAFCGRCERPLYRRGVEKENAKGEMVPYFYYRCASASDTSVPTCLDRPYRSHELEETIFDEFLGRIGDVEVQQKVFVPGEDHTEELETAQAAYNDLTQQLTVTRSISGRKRITEQLSNLDERIAHLETLPNRPSTWSYEGIGQSYTQLWDCCLTSSERGALLRDSGVRAWAVHRDDGRVVVSLELPKKLAERAKAWAADRNQKHQVSST